MVGSPSGKVADCNSALASSTLAPTSNAVQLGSFIEVVVSKSLSRVAKRLLDDYNG